MTFTTFEAQPVCSRLSCAFSRLGSSDADHLLAMQHPTHIRPMMYAGGMMGLGM